MGFFNRFFKKSAPSPAPTNKPKQKSLWTSFKELFTRKQVLDEDLLNQIEEILITADIDIDTTEQMIDHLKKHDQPLDFQEAITILKNHTISLLTKETPTKTQPDPSNLHVILVVGVNGVGKTTTIGKLAAYLTQQKKSVIIGAADTFRAAAVTQLEVWGQRINVPIVSKGMHKDPSSVAYDAIEKALEQSSDVLIIDTAGRLHNKVALMNELAKVKRTITKKIPAAPQETLLVIDGSTGQNAIQQAKLFHQALNITGLVITKLDGQAKGGSIIGIASQLAIPIRYIGTGEQVEDLQPFDPIDFASKLFANPEGEVTTS